MTLLPRCDSFIPHALQAIKKALLDPTVCGLLEPGTASILGLVSTPTGESCEVSPGTTISRGLGPHMVAKGLVG